MSNVQHELKSSVFRAEPQTELDSSTAQCRTGWPPCQVEIPRRKVLLTPTSRVPYSNAANIGERKTWTQSQFCTCQNSVTGQEPSKMYIYCTSSGDSQTSCKVWLASGERRRYSITKPRRETRWNLLGCPKLANGSQPLVCRSSACCEDIWSRYCFLTFFSDCRHMP